MDVQRELNGKVLRDLGEVVDDFYIRFPPSRRDRVITFAGAAPSFRTAVQRACMSRDEQGKMHNHQSRVPAATLRALSVRLMSRYVSARRCRDFDELHDLVRAMGVKGIGPVTTYDVAVRIGAFLGHEPTSVYLHAGVRLGWESLTGVRSNGRDRIQRADLPPELLGCPADDVEDILCTYRAVFAGWRTN
jgi:hypothetical protein